MTRPRSSSDPARRAAAPPWWVLPPLLGGLLLGGTVLWDLLHPRTDTLYYRQLVLRQRDCGTPLPLVLSPATLPARIDLDALPPPPGPDACYSGWRAPEGGRIRSLRAHAVLVLDARVTRRATRLSFELDRPDPPRREALFVLLANGRPIRTATLPAGTGALRVSVPLPASVTPAILSFNLDPVGGDATGPGLRELALRDLLLDPGSP